MENQTIKNQLKPLNGSIAKWENIVNSTNYHDLGYDNCELCQLNGCCNNCIIKIDTIVRNCRGTPYKDWESHQEDHDEMISNLDLRKERIWSREVGCKECLVLSQDELDYLRNLKEKYFKKKEN